MQRGGTAKRDEGAAARVLAALDRMDAGGVRHVFVDDLADPEGGELDRQIERLGDLAPHRRLGRTRIERHAPARKPGRIDAAEHQIGVGDGRRRAAAPVAGGTRIGPGAVRPDGNPLQPVDPRDRAAAGADLDHLDDRDAQRQPAAFLETVDARDLEGAVGLRL